ncbi:hypothetical protein [Helicobacter sp.]|uniref:hypothetical protein n=1 Tax=Helicobacter sp. TaxID=218 RepID=UPI0025BFAECF|nr:hypothetical protein [Helicobacter sp.]MCI5968174.1 hypothetical protein [Helicobacter sp.]MDY2584087.1 hypothetical protein [Helicobacter sp.]
MLFRSLVDKRIKPEHYPFEIVSSIEQEVSGVRGVGFVTEKENALLILTQEVKNVKLKDLIAQNKVIIASDGNALKG